MNHASSASSRLGRLRPSQRSALRLRCGGSSFAEIALRLGIDAAVVRTLIAETYQALEVDGLNHAQRTVELEGYCSALNTAKEAPGQALPERNGAADVKAGPAAAEMTLEQRAMLAGLEDEILLLEAKQRATEQVMVYQLAPTAADRPHTRANRTLLVVLCILFVVIGILIGIGLTLLNFQ